MKTRTTIWTCAAAVALLVGMMAVRRQLDAPTRQAADPRQVVARSSSPPGVRPPLQQQVAQFESAPAATEARDDRAAPLAATVGPFDAAPLRERWEDESADSPWAPRFEGEVRGAFAGRAQRDVRLIDVECRATLCRIEVSFDSPGAFRTLAQIFGELAPLSSARGRSEIIGDRVVAYLAPTSTASPN